MRRVFLILLVFIHFFRVNAAINTAELDGENLVPKTAFGTTKLIPDCTNITIPFNGETNVDVATDISWAAIPDVTGYQIKVGTTLGGEELVVLTNVGNVTTFDLPENLPDNTIIFVEILPVDATGSATSCPEQFTTRSQLPPACTTLTLPLDGATNVAVGTNLEWAPSLDATAYLLRLGTTPGGDEILPLTDVGNVTMFNLPVDLPDNEQIFVTLIPVNGAVEAENCMEEQFTTVMSVDCTTLTVPLNGAIDVDVGVVLEWNESPNAVSYVVGVGTISGGADIFPFDNLGNVTSLDLPEDLPLDIQIFVTILPIDAAGAAVSCQSESFVTGNAAVVAECTNLIAPLNGATDVPIETDLTWGAVNDATSYVLQIGITPGGAEILPLTDIGNVTTFDLPDDLPENTTIYVLVIPVIGTELPTSCIEEQFTTGVAAISLICTNLTTPLDGTTNVPIDIELNWDPVDGATGYIVQVGITSGGEEILPSTDVGNVTTLNLPQNLPEDTVIYVLIIPFNDEGMAVDCVEEQFTTSMELVAPNCTMLTVPLDQDIDVAVDTVIEWNPVTNATGYRVQLSTFGAAGDIFPLQDVGNVTTLDLPNDLPQETEIFVIIIPFNAAGDALGCRQENFITARSNSLPGCTQLVLPTNGATDVPIDTLLEWDPVPNVDGYRLLIGTTPGGADILNNVGIGNFTSFDLPEDLPPLTTIFITIIAFNDAGDAENCLEESFTTGENLIPVPECTNLVFPIDESENVSVSSFINWNAVDGATGYRLSLGTLPGGVDILDNLNVGNVTSFQPLEELPPGSQIFVTIIPFNDQGDAQACAEESFSTAGPELFIPNVFTPNADQFNDFWQVVDETNVVDRIFIFNRFGALLAQFGPESLGWDGTFNGRPLPETDYWYSINLIDATNVRGHFALKR